VQRSTLALTAALAAISTAAPAAAQCDSYVWRTSLHTSGSNPMDVDFGRLDGDAAVDMVVADYQIGRAHV
jgi:hypothetical protein